MRLRGIPCLARHHFNCHWHSWWCYVISALGTLIKNHSGFSGYDNCHLFKIALWLYSTHLHFCKEIFTHFHIKKKYILFSTLSKATVFLCLYVLWRMITTVGSLKTQNLRTVVKYLLSKLINKYKMHLWGWRKSSKLKNGCFACRVLEFGAQHWCWAAHNLLLVGYPSTHMQKGIHILKSPILKTENYLKRFLMHP